MQASTSEGPSRNRWNLGRVTTFFSKLSTKKSDKKGEGDQKLTKIFHGKEKEKERKTDYTPGVVKVHPDRLEEFRKKHRKGMIMPNERGEDVYYPNTRFEALDAEELAALDKSINDLIKAKRQETAMEAVKTYPYRMERVHLTSLKTFICLRKIKTFTNPLNGFSFDACRFSIINLEEAKDSRVKILSNYRLAYITPRDENYALHLHESWNQKYSAVSEIVLKSAKKEEFYLPEIFYTCPFSDENYHELTSEFLQLTP